VHPANRAYETAHGGDGDGDGGDGDGDGDGGDVS
jgi:hypothetical protein